MGNPGFPIPLPVGAPAAPTSGWEMGNPGFPTPLPAGRVWEGFALPGTMHSGVVRSPKGACQSKHLMIRCLDCSTG